MNSGLMKGLIFFIIYCLLVTSMNVLIKLTTESSISSISVMFWQYVIAFVLILPVVVFNKKIGFKTKKLHWHVLRGVAGFGTTYCLFEAVKLINLATTTLLIYSAPLWVLLLSRLFYKEAISLRASVGMIIGFIGVALSLSPNTAHVNGFGVGMAALGGFLFAVVLLVSQKLDETEPHVRVLAYYFIIAIIAILCFFLPQLHLTQLSHITVLDWLYIAGIGVGQVVSLGCMLIAYEYASAGKLASLNYLVILFSAIAQYLVWHTFMPKTEYLGASLIVIGLLLSLKAAKKPQSQGVIT